MNENKKTERRSPLVKMNVGGGKFVTTRDTIFSKGKNFLTTLLSNDDEGRIPCMRDEDGCIFIDRNKKSFEAVLEFLRTGRIFHPSSIAAEQLEVELDFYGIPREDLCPNRDCSHAFCQQVADLRTNATSWVGLNKVKIFQTLSRVVGAGAHTFRFYSASDGQYYYNKGSNFEMVIEEKYVLSNLWNRAVVVVLRSEFNGDVRAQRNGPHEFDIAFEWFYMVETESRNCIFTQQAPET